MSTETQDANATIVADEELLAVVEQNHLQAETAQSLQRAFSPFFTQARDVITKSRGIVVTDANQKLEIKMARACRLELKAIRVSGEKARKEIKEESLRRSKAIDGFAAILTDLIGTEESRLEAQEQFAERQEAARKQALKETREKVLVEIQVDPNLYQLAEMSEETFQNLVEGTKLARAAAAERARKDEAERIERERKDAEERERIRLDNERLKAEAAENEKKAAVERAMAEKELRRLADERAAAEKAAQLERERIARETAEREAALAQERARVAREKADAEAKAKAERDAIEAKARADREAAELLARKECEAVEAKARAERQAADLAAKKEREALEAKHAEERRVADAKAAEEKRKADAELAEQKRLAKDQADRERAAREKAEAELRAQREADARRIASEREAERKAAAAPDRDKLLNYANAIRAIDIPEFTTESAKAIAATIRASRDKFAGWVDEKAGAL